MSFNSTRMRVEVFATSNITDAKSIDRLFEVEQVLTLQMGMKIEGHALKMYNADVLEKGELQINNIWSEIRKFINQRNVDLFIDEFRKQTMNSIVTNFRYQLSQIPGISKVLMKQPAFIKKNYEAIIIE